MAYPVVPAVPTFTTQQADPITPSQVGRVDPTGAEVFTDGGLLSVAIPTTTAGATVVKATPGRLCKILITTSAAAAVAVYDNASAASGTQIGSIAGAAPVGTLTNFQAPALLGITVGGSATLPGMTVFYS